jgi:hypothetical protein
MLLERWDGKPAVTGVALVIAVGEPRRKFSQVALPDWLTAQRTERLRAGCPAIHQDEFHGRFLSLPISAQADQYQLMDAISVI